MALSRVRSNTTNKNAQKKALHHTLTRTSSSHFRSSLRAFQPLLLH